MCGFKWTLSHNAFRIYPGCNSLIEMNNMFYGIIKGYNTFNQPEIGFW